MDNEAVEALEDGAPAYPAESDPRDVAAAETIRTRFDCNGTEWARRTSVSGTSCHGMPWPKGAPLIGDCTAYIEASAPGGGYKIVKAEEGSRFSPFDVGDSFLFNLGGGRRYRVQLRLAGRTIPHSYLMFDLTGMGAPHPLPNEATETTSAAGAKAPSHHGASEVLALGNDPIAAMIGSALGKMDPSAQLMFALLEQNRQQTREFAERTVAQSEKTLQTFAGIMRETMRTPNSDTGVTAMLREQTSAATRAAETAAREAREMKDALHSKELAEARASGGNAPPTWAPMAFAMGEKVLSHGVATLIQTAGADTARAVVNGVGNAAAAAAAG